MKKEVLRKCLATNQMLDKDDLIRICKTKDGKIFIDPTMKANGRGAYVKKDKEAIAILEKKKLLQKAFKCEIDPSLYQELYGYIESK